MAIPILSGPGAITTVMVLAGEAGSMMNVGILLLVILLSVFIAYMMLAHSQLLLRVLRQTGTKILTRIMGLIMSVIAVQFVINGLSDVVPFILARMDR
jgi:multiple antibiotic resistance protein